MPGRFSTEGVFRARDRFSRTTSNMARAVERFLRRAHRSLRSVNTVVSGLGGGLLKAGRAAARYGAMATAAAGGIGYAIGKAGSDFEQAITNVGAVGLQTRDQIKPLEKLALKLGETTKFTATEAANAMEILKKAGFSNSEVLAGVPGVLNAAAASGLEMAEVADHVSNVLKGMGRSPEAAAKAVADLGYTGKAAAEMTRKLTMDATQAGRVADVLTLASSRTNSTIGSLGESMRNVSATARQLNIPLEDTVAGVAALQDVGLDASVAGSALNTMLTKMAKPPAAVAAKMRQLGVTFKDADGNMLPFSQVLANLSKAGDKAGGSFDKVAFFADLVGLRGQKAAANLAELFRTGKVEKLAQELNNAKGAAEKMAKLRMDTLEGDLTKLNSAAEGVKISLFKTKSGPLRGVVQGITKWVKENKTVIVAGFTDIVERVKPLWSTFVREFKSTFRGISEGVKTVFGQGKDSTKQWAAILPKLAKNLGQLAAIALGVLGTFAAFAVGMVVLASAIWTGVRTAFDKVAAVLGGAIFAIEQWWDDLTAMFDAKGMELEDKVYKIGLHIIDGLVRGINFVASAPVKAVKSLGDAMLWGLKKVLGLASPSKETAKLGVFTAAGFAKGIKTGTGAVQQALDDMTAMAVAKPIAPTIKPTVQWPDLKPKVKPTVQWPDLESKASPKVAWPKLKPKAATQDVMVRQRFMTMGALAESNGGLMTRQQIEPQIDDGAPRLPPPPRVVNPAAGEQASKDELVAAMRQLAEAMRRSEASEVTIRDESGKAEVTRAPKGGKARLRVQKSGAF
jgi:TP901 family phage tail tape measure protein